MPRNTSAAVEMFERGILERGGGLVDKWAHMIDAEGQPPVTDPYQRYALAQLLESTNCVLSAEAAVTATTTVFGTSYVKAMLGMTRQIFPRAFGLQLVSVQPMDRPTGKIFHLKVTREDGSSLGIRPQDDRASYGYNEHTVSKDYAVHSGGEGAEIMKGLTLSITDSDISVTSSRKLKTSATWELQTDLAAYHNLNAVDILQGAAVDEISQELDARIVIAIRNAAIAHGTVTFGPAPAGFPVEKWSTRLQRAILEADKAIFKSSLRYPNVMVCGIDAMTELRDLSTFTLAPNINWEQSGYGVIPVGNLNGQYNVFMSRACPDKEILLGRKGSGFLDAGVVYAPYVALYISDRFFDVTLQKTIQSFAQRDEIVTVSNTLFHRIRLDETAAAGIN